MAKPQGWVKPQPEPQTLPARIEEELPLPAPRGDLDVLTLGRMMAKSGFFSDVREEAQAVVKILAGKELGIGPVASMTGIYVVQGRVTLSANLIASLVKRSRRYNYRVVTLTEEECRLEFTENGEKSGESLYTMEDARRAGVAGKPTWKQYPRNMLFNRALTNGVRLHCPDVTTTPCYTPEEMGAIVTEDETIIDTTATVQTLS